MGALALVTGALTVPACSPAVECTLVGCVDAFFVTVRRSSGASLDRGSYAVVAVADGRRHAFECDVGTTAQCAPVGDAGNGRLTAFGAPGGVAGLDLELPPTTRTASVRVERDGVLLAERTFTPSYDRTAPNGPGCPSCTYAAETLELPDGAAPGG